MKNKITLLVLIFVFIFSISAYSADNSFDIKTSIEGDTVQAEVIADFNYSVLSFCFCYDANTLVFDSGNFSGKLDSSNNMINPEYGDGVIKVSVLSAENIEEGNICDLAFKIKPNSSNTTTLKLTEIISGNNEEDIILCNECLKEIELPVAQRSTSGGGGIRRAVADNTGSERIEESVQNISKENSADIESEQLVFDDVKETDWFYNAVKFAFENGITSGVSETEFAPNDNVTRGQFITMLCRAYKISEMTGDNFFDCGNTWYTGYLAAAKQLGISNGVGDNMFAPEKEITREEMVTLIYNYLKSIGETEGEFSDTQFADDYLISDWAKPGVAFASEKSYVNGKGNNTFDPKGRATRAELAQIFYNIFK